jgi:hypothetical protein
MVGSPHIVQAFGSCTSKLIPLVVRSHEGSSRAIFSIASISGPKCDLAFVHSLYHQAE